MSSVVKTNNLEKTYMLGKTEVKALSDINLEINKTDFLAIAGPSGSGKTTLLNIIGCLDKATKGSIEIDGLDVSSLNSNELAEIRNEKIGFIFQTFNLIPVLTAYENVEFPLIIGKYSKKDKRDRIMNVLKQVGIDKYAEHRPDELSGGQRQRVAIARALVKDPEIILADEPTANLDSETGESIVKLMLELNREKGSTFIFSTHDDMIIRHAAKKVNLHDGRLATTYN